MLSQKKQRMEMIFTACREEKILAAATRDGWTRFSIF